MVVSSTTMSWAVRMTNRSVEGSVRRLRSVPVAHRMGVAFGRGRGELRRFEGIDDDLSAGTLRTGRFLRLVYGGCLRLASDFTFSSIRGVNDVTRQQGVGALSTGGRPEREDASRHMRADARRNYDLLVSAAREVFDEDGGGASMEAIARRAGVGVGTLYRHFPKRIDVVEAVYRTDVDTLVHTAETVTDELEPWPAVVAFLEAFVRYAQGKRTFLNELREAFDKNPDLRVDMVGAGPASNAARPRTGTGRRSSAIGYRRVGSDATGRPDVHQRDTLGGPEHAAARR